MAQLRKRCEWQLQYICPEGGRSSFLHTPLISVSMIYGFLLLGFFFKGVKMRCTVLHLLYLFCATMHFGPCPKIKWCLI